ncbi:MAG: hypothetical protein HY912_14025 [Desulfomonile tiedjei]|uniref:Uncharacterized protein n=1 Tax=Desulfomonile tiedjei TaxID=2358 RepID=A0A9D6Z126_9BACT|nr:hypothetical protein [Desulfomonile tiedjei]
MPDYGLISATPDPTAPRTAWSISDALLSMCLMLAGLIAWTMPFTNEDLFLALCAGRDICAGRLGAPDQWSFSVPGTLWVDQSWLSHLIYYLSYKALEDLGPVLVKGALLAGTVWLLYFRCRALSVPRGISMLAVTLGTLGLAPFMKIRAENFGLFYFVLLTTILTLPASWGRWRYVGALFVLAAWSNSHGSFMLGFLLIGLRLLISLLYGLEAKRSDPESAETLRSRGRDAAGWAVTLGLAVLIMAFANPYGPENLSVVFRQLSAKSVTDLWIDWQPLIHGPSFFDRGFFKAFSTRPFVMMLIFAACALVSMIVMARNRRVSPGSLAKSGSDPVMEALIPLMLAPLVFKFQRMILFAAPALVPVLALIMQGWLLAARSRFSRVDAFFTGRRKFAVSAFAGLIGLALLGTVFYKSILRYSVSNPLNGTLQNRSIASRLMSHNLSRVDAVDFLKKNGIQGRVFTNLFLTDYLLLKLPEIKLFFDLRAQSFFPDAVVKDYLSVFNPQQHDLDNLSATLERTGTELVILDTADRPYYFNLAAMLMESGRWVCIYKDQYLIILAKSDPLLFDFTKAPDQLDRLWYGQPETRIVSQAFFAHFAKGSIDPEMIRRLGDSLKKRADPEAYALLAAAMQGSSQCLGKEAKEFLDSEAMRLAASGPQLPGGALTYCQSALRLLLILEENEASCGTPKGVERYRLMRARLSRVVDGIRDLYGGI